MKKAKKTIHLKRCNKKTPENLRGIVLSVRVSEVELFSLRQRANIMHLSIGAYMRQAALFRQLPPPPAPELNWKIYTELGHIGGNIYQISRRLNFGETLTEPEINAVAALLRKVRLILLGIENDCESG